MKVRATREGYYDLKRRRPGEVFDIDSEKAFSKHWMEKVEAKAKAKRAKEIVEEDEVGSADESVI